MTGLRAGSLGCTIVLVLCLCAACCAEDISRADVLKQARQYHCDARLTEAITAYKQVLAESNIPAEIKDAQYSVAACHLSIGAYDDAVKEFLEFAERFHPADPQGTLAIVHAGNCRVYQGKMEEAEKLFAKALQTEGQPPENKRVWYGWANLGMAKVLVSRGKCEEALPYIDAARQNATDERVSVEAGELLVQCSDELKSDEDDAQSLESQINLVRGKQYMEERQYAVALPYLSSAVAGLKKSAEVADALILLGHAYYYTKDLDNAWKYYQKVVKMDKEAEDFEGKGCTLVATALMGQAQVAAGRKQYEEAVSRCREASELGASVDANLMFDIDLIRADALEKLGRTEQAADVTKKAYESLARINPRAYHSGAARNAVANVYFRSGKYVDATNMFRELLRVDLTEGLQAECRYKLGVCYYKANDITLAKAYMQDVIENYSDTTWAAQAKGALSLWPQSK